MTQSESGTLVKAALTLLVAGLVRWGVERVHPAPELPGTRSALPALDSAARAAADAEARAATPLAPGERIDPNRADEPELQRLPGVGPSVARAIVAFRTREGGFGGPDDLTRVRGIGPATVTRLRDRLDFSRPPASVALVRDADDGARGYEPLVGPAADEAAAPAAVDVNHADAGALEALPGIGPALARRILESRQRDGPFRTPDDLLRVRGIGPAVLARLKPLVRLGGG